MIAQEYNLFIYNRLFYFHQRINPFIFNLQYGRNTEPIARDRYAAVTGNRVHELALSLAKSSHGYVQGIY